MSRLDSIALGVFIQLTEPCEQLGYIKVHTRVNNLRVAGA